MARRPRDCKRNHPPDVATQRCGIQNSESRPYLGDPSLESNRREKNRGATSNTRADVRPELAG